MDRIEPVEGAPEGQGQGQEHLQPPPSDGSNSRPTSSRPQRPRVTSVSSVHSQRQRRPTIRLQRFSSLENTPTVSRNQQQEQEQQQNGQTEQTAENRPPAIRQNSARDDRNISRVDTGAVPRISEENFQGSRRRSSSEPRPGRWSAPNLDVLTRLTTGDRMHSLAEEPTNQTSIGATPSNQPLANSTTPERPAPAPIQKQGSRNILRWTSEAAMNRFTRNRASTVSGISAPPVESEDEYQPHMVDVLDVIDPEVSALSTLTNVQNSLFVPNLGPLVNRNQTYTLSPPQVDPRIDEEGTTTTSDGEDLEDKSKDETPARPMRGRAPTSISAVLDDGDRRFAVLPDGTSLEGWTYQEVEELNDHVRHMLHSRRSKFKRAMKGFGKYVSKPLGFLITLYATLITLFGLAWVLFLIGWINVKGRQLYIINVIDNVLVALFAIMGDGLAPFRCVDTYHMIFIAHYTFKSWKIREKRKLPGLKDKNDLPIRREYEIDVEFGDTPKDEAWEFSVLNRLQQQKLTHHQNKFAKSHTFYKPHETFTHYAFPMRILIAVVVVLDCHSCLQIALGSCTWSIDYHVRPFALTTVILCCSIACNITGGVLIMIGDRMTRKKDVVERLFRQQLTREAMKKIERKKRKKQKHEEKEARASMQLQSPSDSSQPLKEDPPKPQPYHGT